MKRCKWYSHTHSSVYVKTDAHIQWRSLSKKNENKCGYRNENCIVHARFYSAHISSGDHNMNMTIDYQRLLLHLLATLMSFIVPFVRNEYENTEWGWTNR